ncbi:MAG: hypothetical protein SPG09_03890 [Lachnospiraceae bacterium]|nr:hypothetical protein [bacterium]MDY5516738.1 hypothetical protein [Lachnospiraceae bacterium]
MADILQDVSEELEQDHDQEQPASNDTAQDTAPESEQQQEDAGSAQNVWDSQPANGDLGYHRMTGRSQKAKHHSAFAQKEATDYSEDEQTASFQRRLVARCTRELEEKIEDADINIRYNNRVVQGMKIYMGDQYDTDMKILEKFHKNAAEANRLTQRMEKKQAKLHVLKEQLAQDEQEMGDLITEITQLTREKERLKEQVDRLTQGTDQMASQAAAMGVQTEGMSMMDRIRRWHLRNKGQRSAKKAQEQGERYAQVSGLLEQKKTRHEELTLAMAHRIQKAASATKKIEDDKNQVDSLKRDNEKITKDHAERLMGLGRHDRFFVNAVVAQTRVEMSENEKAHLTQERDTVKHRIVNTDVVDVSRADKSGTLQSMEVGGKTYYFDPDAKEGTSRILDSDEAEGLVHEEDAKIVHEENEIIRQLKEKEIFQYINSDNLMEYLDYDEEKGDFVFSLYDQLQEYIAANGLEGMEIPETYETNIPPEVRALINQSTKKHGFTDDVIGTMKKREELEASGWNPDVVQGFQALGSGTLNVIKWLANMGLGVGLGMSGLDKLGKSDETWAQVKDVITKFELDPVAALATMIGMEPVANALRFFVENLDPTSMQSGMTKIGLGESGEMLGDQNGMRAAERTGDTSARGSKGATETSGGMALGSLLLLLADGLFGKNLTQLGAGMDFDAISNSSFALLGLDLWGKAGNLNAFSGLGAVLGMAKGTYDAVQANKDVQRQEQTKQNFQEKGQSRFARTQQNAETVSKVARLEGIVDIGSALATPLLAIAGLGGLAYTVAKIAVGVAVKKIGGALIRSGSKKQILQSPELLGGIKYDHKLITDAHFQYLFTLVTQLGDTDALAETLKVVDGIDLHRTMLASLQHPEQGQSVREALAGFGYTDPSKYGQIKLRDLHKKMDMTDDWRKVIRNAIEVKGIDYDTNWTKFAKAMSGNMNHYENDQRLTRSQLRAQRREKLDSLWKSRPKWENSVFQSPVPQAN